MSWVMERMIKEAKIKELLTGQRQFGRIIITDCKVNEKGVECPVTISEQEFLKPDGLSDILVTIIYEKWQVET